MATAVTVGRAAEALLVVDDLVQRQADDEPLLALALLVLYDAFMHGRPIAGAELDRARMLRLAEVYRARGGPSLTPIGLPDPRGAALNVQAASDDLNVVTSEFVLEGSSFFSEIGTRHEGSYPLRAIYRL